MCITGNSQSPQPANINALSGSASVHEWRLSLGLCTAVIHRIMHKGIRSNGTNRVEMERIVRLLGGDKWLGGSTNLRIVYA